MRKILLYYWYAPEYKWCKLYDEHIKNVVMYKDRFDECRFVIASDKPSDFLGTIVERITDIIPDAKITFYGNDKETRESNYFYNEVAMKLDEFDDNDLIFFAHNKGVASWYVDLESLYYWIDFMYWANLNNTEFLSNFESNQDLCCAGTFMTDDYKYWGFLKYLWHYSGTYFWFMPKRVHDHIVSHNEIIPKNSRYFTEGFFGSVIENDDRYRLALYGKRSSKVGYKDFVCRQIPRHDRKTFQKVYDLEFFSVSLHR